MGSTVEPVCVPKGLEGKVAIITGGASGIGEATVRLFTKHGAKVIIADIADEAGKKVAHSVSPPATYFHCDVTNEKEVRAVVNFAIENHGRLDIMLNIAGTIDTYLGSVAEYEMEEYERVTKVDVKGVLHGIKHAARVMIPNQKGCIISIASTAGVLGGTGPYAYTAAKHAVVGLTKNGAAELGKYGIRVNCISPYGVATALSLPVLLNAEYTPGPISKEDKVKVQAVTNGISNLKGVTLEAEDIADAALYLAGEKARYVSGHNLVVDGGFTVVNHSLDFY